MGDPDLVKVLLAMRDVVTNNSMVDLIILGYRLPNLHALKRL